LIFHFPEAAVRRRVLPTQTGHPNFPEAAAEARWSSVSFAAMKLPFVTSRLRPRAADQGFVQPAICMTGAHRNLPFEL